MGCRSIRHYFKYNGSTWTSFTSGITTNLRAIYFISPTNGYAVGDGGVILKYDGASWKKVPSGTTSALYGVSFSDANTGWVVGASGTIISYKGITNTVVLPLVNSKTICYGEAVPTLSASGTNVFWYSDFAATKQIGTGNSYKPNVSAVGTYTFYVTQSVNSLKSLPVAVTLTIKATPKAPITGTNITINGGGTLAPFTASGSFLVWY